MPPEDRKGTLTASMKFRHPEALLENLAPPLASSKNRTSRRSESDILTLQSSELNTNGKQISQNKRSEDHPKSMTKLWNKKSGTTKRIYCKQILTEKNKLSRKQAHDVRVIS